MNYMKGRGFVDELSPEGRLLLVGTSPRGIGGEAFYIKDGTDPRDMLGESLLTEAYMDAIASGLSNDRILIYRLNGVGGVVEIKEDGAESPLFLIESIAHDETSAGITVSISDEALVVYDELEPAMTKTYRLDEFEHVAALTREMNRNADFGLSSVRARLSREKALSECTFSTSSFPMYTADSEHMLVVSEETDMEWYMGEILTRLKSAFIDDEDVAGEGYSAPCEVVCLVGVPVDLSEEVTRVMARYASQKTEEEGVFVTAVLEASLLPDKVEEPGHDVDEFGNYVDELGVVIEHDPDGARKEVLERLKAYLPERDEQMRHVQVVVGQRMSSVGERSVATAFAANLAQKSVEVSMTNKEIVGLGNFIPRLSKKELVGLESNGYTCIVPSVRRNVVARKSLHFYTYDTPTYQEKPHLLRLASYIGRLVSMEMDAYVGEPGSLDLDEAKRMVEESAKELVSRDIILSFDLDIERPEIDRIHVRANVRIPGYVDVIRVKHEVRYEERELFRWMDA